MPVSHIPGKRPEVSVIVPARNEEALLATCLESLVSQTGVEFEIIVVNDHSTDRTGEIAASFAGVRVIEAGPLPPGWTGKNNAVACGARQALGEWLLFTDADTVHLPGSLSRALDEAKQHEVEMLSYSPEQIAVTFWERAILPVVFAELARQYPPSKVSDPASPIAAANGQFILIRRGTYDAIGGHAAIAEDILEDVALARRVKASGRKMRFRYAADAVRTRMYRNFAQLREGWTKNLALLFPRPGWLALKISLLWGIPWLLLTFPLSGLGELHHRWWWSVVITMALAGNIARLQRANFDLAMEFLGAWFGMPMFAYLLLRSKRMYGKGTVAWKGRSYGNSAKGNTDAVGPCVKDDLSGSGDLPSAAKAASIDSPDGTAKAVPFPRSLPPTSSDRRQKTVLKTPLLMLLTLFAITAYSLAQIMEEPRFNTTMIEGGHSVGPLKVGDSSERALEVFPKKDIDQEWEDACGSTIDWVDSTNPVGHGDVFIRIKKGKVFQIESSTTRFHTAEDITTFDSPEKVEKSYKDLRAWVLLTPPSPALGSRPPVFWIDKKKGIAFELAYDAPHHKRYVYKIIVFQPNRMFCPEQETVDSLKWQAIGAYAQEPPRELSPER